ncbi:MAG TPA: methyltransferase domain-containing protein [Acidobacteriota bacterium]|nr:methyltransferase domain-containing protein [Acidobacteriota bacterium]
MNPSLPSADLLKLQAVWLADARQRILRNAEFSRRKRVLDLGAGYGLISAELKRRSAGTVIAMDRSVQALSSFFADVPVVCADAGNLPFRNRSFDFVFSQNVLMWTGRLEQVLREVARIMQPNGTWVLFEPDYGGMMEYPYEIETHDLWIQALHRAGADPVIGRKLPAMLSAAGWMVRVELLPRLLIPQPSRFDVLEELPLTEEQKGRLKEIRSIAEEIGPAGQLAHLPYFLIIADRS